MTAAGKNIAAIIIAAGSSSRLGTSKQLLSYAGTTLLQHIVQVSIESVAYPVIVVLGANADRIINETDIKASQVVVNKNWQEGMASSIRCGVETLNDIDSLTKGAVILLCDQPHVTADLINNLITAHLNTGKSIVASEYYNVLGAPAFFHKSIFSELLQLKGDSGARLIIKQHGKDVAAVAFPQGNVDIDTAADYERLSGSDQSL